MKGGDALWTAFLVVALSLSGSSEAGEKLGQLFFQPLQFPIDCPEDIRGSQPSYIDDRGCPRWEFGHEVQSLPDGHYAQGQMVNGPCPEWIMYDATKPELGFQCTPDPRFITFDTKNGVQVAAVLESQCYPQEPVGIACWKVYPDGHAERDASNPQDTAGKITTSVLPKVSAGFNCDTSVAFSPNGKAEVALLKAIDGAKKSIYIAMYTFTNHDIVNALTTAKSRGVLVSVKLDKTESQSHLQQEVISMLKNYKIPVQVSALKALQHDKYSVVDESIVVTGSYNYTQSAEHWNRENLVVLTCPWLAKLYLANWQGLK